MLIQCQHAMSDTLGELPSSLGMASCNLPIRLLPCAKMACMSLFSAPIFFIIDLASSNSPWRVREASDEWHLALTHPYAASHDCSNR